MSSTSVIDSGATTAGDPGPGSWHRRLRHSDAVVTAALGGLTLLLCAGYVAVDLHYNQGRLIAPLDDVYIHLQYGRQIGAGHFFQYNTGDPVSMGASSLLYAFVLGSFAALGLDGTLLLAAAVLFGIACTVVAVALTYLVARELGGRPLALWAGLLTALSGPLLWGAASGMEVGLVTVLIMATLLAFLREQPRRRFLVTPLLGMLLAVARPEGLIVALSVVLAMMWTIGRHAWADRRPVRSVIAPAALAVLPLAAGVGQALFMLLTTGSAQANGVQAKSWLNAGALRQPTEVLDHTLTNVSALLSTYTGLAAQDQVPPGTLPLAVVGAVSLVLAPTRGLRTVAGIALLSLILVFLSVSTLGTALWQNLRYFQPFLPLLIVLAVVGIAAITSRASPRAFHGVLAVGLVFTLVSVPVWALRLGQQAATIREAPVSIGNWLRGHLPPDSTIAVNDVGAVAYFSGHRTFDLVGLATNGMAASANNGAGTMYEALVDLPPDRRPDFFSIYDSWPGVPVDRLAGSGVLGDDPLITFSLLSPSRPVPGFAPPPCQTDRVCPSVSVWRADWSAAGSGDRPDRPVPGTVRDHVNVGDLPEEAAHAWVANPPVLGVQPQSDVRTQRVDGREVVDSSRRVVGGETFTLSNLEPGRDVVLTGRIGAGKADATAAPAVATGDPNGPAVTLAVGDQPVGRWFFSPDAQDEESWSQSSITIPGRLVTGSTITVHTGPLQPFLAPYPDYRSYGYWASQ